MKKISYIAACLFALALAACDKSQIKQDGDYATGVQLKFFHAAPGLQGLDAYVNGVQVTPVQTVSVTDNFLPAAIATGYFYNGVFPGSNYSAVASGNTVIKIVTSTPAPALVSPQIVGPGSTITNVTQATGSGEAYSIITSGLQGSATTPIKSFIIKDVFPTAVAGKAYIRLAHMSPNAGAVDITATFTPTGGTATTVTSITNISYGNVSDFVPVDVNPLGTTSYTFQSVLTGTTTKFGTTTLTAAGAVSPVALTPGRYYTLVLKGLSADYPVPSTSITLRATARPTKAATPGDQTYLLPEIYFNVAGLNYYTNK